MKNLLLIAALFCGLAVNAQISKSDLEMTFAKFPFASMEAIYIKNSRTYYTDGSSTLQQDEYKADIFTYTLTETSLHLYWYEDSTKAKQNGVMILPYAKIIAFSASADGFTIEMEY